MPTKPQIETLTNPALPHGARVRLKDGREAQIVDRAFSRRERLLAIVGVTGVHMTAITEIERAWTPTEHRVVFDGRALV